MLKGLAMSLTPGTKLGPYEILAPLGAGGMGEVYKAKDTRLDRTVAIKVLPAHVASHPEVRQRFEREARAVSSLNHPHICTLFDIGSENGIDFMVMEHIEGDTLADRLKKGALPLDQALQYGIEIADALDKAHRQGVVHRDLKPGNIMLTKTGAKLLDFGLAKMTAAETNAGGLSALPTEAQPLTKEGSILGTFQYMAPEQLEGNEADARSDIFAFGSVLYEMVTGKRAFEGKSQASLIAAILEHEPPAMSTLQTMTPPVLDHVVRRCLAKDPDERWQTAHDLTAELNWIVEAGSQPGVTSPLVPGRRVSRRLAAGILGFLLGSVFVWNLKPGAPTAGSVTRLRMGLQPAEEIGGFFLETVLAGWRPTRTAVAFSPDGRHLVYRGGAGETWQLYLRPMDQAEASPMPGTEGAVGPFFSPDGQWVGFWANGELRKVRLTGGPSAAVCETPLLFGASWGEENTIVFAQYTGGLWSVSADGGTPKELTTLREGEVSHRLPEVLPGAKAVIFTVSKRSFEWKDAEIAMQDLATGERRVLVAEAADARYVRTGHLLYARLGTLMAVPFDLERLEVTGGSLPVIEGVMQAVYAGHSAIDTGAAQFSVSGAGSLVYVEGGTYPLLRKSLVWVDREGRAQPLGGTERGYWHPRLSPDGRRVAVFISEPEQRDIFVYDISRGTLTRVTQEGANAYPAWSPDGKRVAFQSTTGGPANIFWVQPDGSALERLTTSENRQYGPFDLERLEVTGGSLPVIEGVMQAVYAGHSAIDTGAAQFSVSGAGSLVYVEGGTYPLLRKSLVWVDREGRAQPLGGTERGYWHPRLSPDGRRVAVFISEPEQRDIFVYDISRGTLTRVTQEGANAYPAWSPDGKRVAFQSTTGGPANIFWVQPDGSALERLTTSENRQYPASWSPDGKALAFLEGRDIWVLPFDNGEHEPRPVVQTRFEEEYPTFSPDGRWLAYTSDESGRREVYVQPYPGPGPRTQISVEGGMSPAWARNGRELFYRVLSGGRWGGKRKMMAVKITTDPTFIAGKPRMLFEEAGYQPSEPFRSYDVAADGRFLMLEMAEQPSQRVTELRVVLNWFEELKRLVPTN